MQHSTFTIDGQALKWTGDGEYLRIEPWGTDSIRVRSSQMHEPEDPDWALLRDHHESADAVHISIDDQQGQATITNGSLMVKAQA